MKFKGKGFSKRGRPSKKAIMRYPSGNPRGANYK